MDSSNALATSLATRLDGPGSRTVARPGSRLRGPLLIVDWSDFEPGREWVMLKAAVPTGRRVMSLYERVFLFSRDNSPDAHREFLRNLRSILQASCSSVAGGLVVGPAPPKVVVRAASSAEFVCRGRGGCSADEFAVFNAHVAGIYLRRRDSPGPLCWPASGHRRKALTH